MQNLKRSIYKNTLTESQQILNDLLCITGGHAYVQLKHHSATTMAILHV